MSTASPSTAPPLQRRFVTLLFADLSGSTRLSSRLEAEDYAALLAELTRTYRRGVERHGGLVVRIQGDGMLAVFGYPTPREDDGRRAVEAALELHAAARVMRVSAVELDEPLSLHSGVHAGLVLVGEGDAETGRLELTGVTPNVAARLSAAAGPDELLVSAETLGPDSGHFVIDARRTLRLEGAAAPTAALSVVDRAPGDTPFAARTRRGLAPFVGRERVLAALDAALQGPGDSARAVVLTGAPGMGKTRVAGRFLERCEAEGRRVLRGYCASDAAAEPLQPFLQVVRALVAPATGEASGTTNAATSSAPGADAATSLATLAPGWAPPAGFVDHVLGRPSGAAVAPAALQQGLAGLLHALAQARPTVLFIDDWQWADDGSHQVLAALASAAAPLRVLLAARDEGRPDLAWPPGAERLVLPPLGPDEAEATVRRLLPLADPFVVRELIGYAGGNPLFLEELCHHEAAAQAHAPAARAPRGEAWLQALIASRVARLPKVQRGLLRSAAVLGHTVPAWLFERLTGCNTDDPLLQALAAQDLLFPGEQPGTLRFKHGLTRDVVYDGVGLAERRRLHRLAAEALANRAPADVSATAAEACEALAYHFDAGGLPERAAPYAEAAGDRAVLASALDRAKSHYRAALGALGRQTPSEEVARRWGGIAQRLGLVSVFDPSREELRLFEQAVALATRAGDRAASARAQYWLGYLHYALGDAPAALRHLHEAGQQARATEDVRLAVQIDATLGQALASAGRYREAHALLDAAIAIKRRHRTGAGQAMGLTYSLTCKGYALGDQGDFDGAEACFDEALNRTGCEQPEAIGSVRGWLGAVRLWQGRCEDAARFAGEACRDGERVRSLHLMAMGRAVAAAARWRQGGHPQALDELREATGWLAHRGNALFASLNHGWLAEALAATGDAAGARQQAALALRRARRTDLLGSGPACRAMARLEREAGRLAAASRWLERAERWAAQRDSRREQAENLVARAELALAGDDIGRAGRLLDEADAAFAHMGMVAQRQVVERLRQPH